MDGGDIWGVVRPWRGVGLLLDDPGLGGVAWGLVDDDGAIGLGDVAGRRGRGEADDLVLAVVLGLRLHLDFGVLFILHLRIADVFVSVVVFFFLALAGGEA